jgi:hypothetical protein
VPFTTIVAMTYRVPVAGSITGVPVMPTVGAIEVQVRSPSASTGRAPCTRNEVCHSGAGAAPAASASKA